MKAEAEANAEADKKERDKIDKLNQADSLIFQTETQLKELGDKFRHKYGTNIRYKSINKD